MMAGYLSIEQRKWILYSVYLLLAHFVYRLAEVELVARVSALVHFFHCVG